MKNELRSLGGAFLVGGCFGILMELLLLLFLKLNLPYAGSIMASLAVVGLLGSLLYVFGLYQKLEKFGGCGSYLPFSGFAAGTASMIIGMHCDGVPLKKAIFTTLKIMLIFIMICIAVSFLFGIIAALIG